MKKIIITSTLFLLIFSCSKNRSENKPIVENAVDNAESSVSNSITKGTRYSRGTNMVDQIYNELIKNNKNLQTLDNKINNIDDKTDETTLEYNDIINKSETYYNDAKSLVRSVTDSITKKEIEKEIEISSEKYDLKTKNIKDLINKINQNRDKIHNTYIIFKIKKTLPEIEKYQNAHPLKTDSLENFIKKQNLLLNELKNLK